jgi:hypothetical protein
MITICIHIFSEAAPLRWMTEKRKIRLTSFVHYVLITNTFFVVDKIPRILPPPPGGEGGKTEETRKDSDKILVFPLLQRGATVQAPVSEVQTDTADPIFWPTSQTGHTGPLDCTG